MGIRDGLVGNLKPLHTDKKVSSTCLEQESGSWNQSRVGDLQSCDFGGFTRTKYYKVLQGAADGLVFTLQTHYNCIVPRL